MIVEVDSHFLLYFNTACMRAFVLVCVRVSHFLLIPREIVKS